MQTDIIFRDLEKSEALEAYLIEKIGSSLETYFEKDENGHATIRVETDRHRTLTRKPSFMCELIFKPSYQKRTIKIRKTGEDIYSAAHEVAVALKAIMRRRTGRKAQHRRHEHSRELRELLMAS
ncbi:HPF/RaiA family ribosome-associated protein [Bdellovibrio sp. HCB337]|uniref:HPF/RaiA family ribosome-associated protein n=1 Tax=Bdellovibrio sp. HCB337 TaxID=3394358 RepID=UPI0039A6FFB7